MSLLQAKGLNIGQLCTIVRAFSFWERKKARTYNMDLKMCHGSLVNLIKCSEKPVKYVHLGGISTAVGSNFRWWIGFNRPKYHCGCYVIQMKYSFFFWLLWRKTKITIYYIFWYKLNCHKTYLCGSCSVKQ